MPRLSFLLLLGLLTGCTDADSISSRVDVPDRPNILLIVTDDQGYGDIAAHGNSLIQTPNLDRLHSQSIRLTNFHVDPTCSPSRAALMTGRYSTRTGVWHTIMGRSLMRTEELTLAETLAEAGYRTGLFGKWHLGDNYPLRPQDQGFQDVFLHGGGGVGQTPDYFGNDYFDDTYFRNGTPEPVSGYCTDIWFDAALSFLEADPSRPFFAYLSTNAPHFPNRVDSAYSAPYEQAGLTPGRAKFYGMITNIDDNMGRLLDRLDALGLSDDTIVIFMTDNGSAEGVWNDAGAGFSGFNAGMRGRKGSEYDGGHRVPFFIRWPGGGLQGGRDVARLTAHIDLYPTLLDLVGIDRPAGPPVDGISLVPLLTDSAASWPERTLFVHSQRIEHPEKWRQSSVMTERYRLVNGTELYDLSTDPGQANDLAAEQPQLVQTLRADYEAWWQSLTPVFDDDVAIGLGSEDEPSTRLTAHDWHASAEEIPWDQGHVANDLVGNGFWAVDVARSGRYRITLRTRPARLQHPLDATSARLRIGLQELSQPLPDGATAAVFETLLEPGPTRLQTWLTAADGPARGAYFVEVERLAPP